MVRARIRKVAKAGLATENPPKESSGGKLGSFFFAGFWGFSKSENGLLPFNHFGGDFDHGTIMRPGQLLVAPKLWLEALESSHGRGVFVFVFFVGDGRICGFGLDLRGVAVLLLRNQELHLQVQASHFGGPG